MNTLNCISQGRPFRVALASLIVLAFLVSFSTSAFPVIAVAQTLSRGSSVDAWAIYARCVNGSDWPNEFGPTSLREI